MYFAVQSLEKMAGEIPAGSVFMCRLCNLFSPSHSQLFAHCSQLHPQQEPVDDIIIALQPLAADPTEAPAENPVKRKRGRPKGSTKKVRTDWVESQANSTDPLIKDEVQREEESKNKEAEQQGENHGETLGLECRECHRSFSNRRQILKHICLKEVEEEEEENGKISGRGASRHSGNLDPSAAEPDPTFQTPEGPGLVKEKDGF